MSHTSLFEGRNPYHEAQPGNRHVLASQWCVGATLKSAREAGSESLEDVAKSVRIRAEYLAAIEEENYYGLPGWAHAVGYVRSYAMYLGLDSAPLVKRVRDQLALREHVFAQRADIRSNSFAKMASVGGVAILFVVIAMGLWTTGLAKNAALYLRPVPDRVVAFFGDTLAAGSTAGPTLAAAKSDAVPPAAQPPQNSGTLVFAPLSAGPSQRSLTVNPIRAGAGMGRPSAAGAGLLILKPLPRHSMDRGALSFGQVTLRAKARVWFRVEDRQGGIVAEREMARGEVQRLPDVRDLLIATRDGGAIEYYVDGVYAGVVGAQGKSVRGLSLAKLAVHRAGG